MLEQATFWITKYTNPRSSWTMYFELYLPRALPFFVSMPQILPCLTPLDDGERARGGHCRVLGFPVDLKYSSRSEVLVQYPAARVSLQTCGHHVEAT